MSSYLYKVWEDRKTELIKNASTFKLKCGVWAKIGRTIKSFPLNYETVQDTESAVIRDCFRKSTAQYNVM